MPLASGGSGRLDRLCLPAGAVKPPFISSHVGLKIKTPSRAVLRPRRRLDLCCAVDLPQVGQGLYSPPVTTYDYLGELFALQRDNSKGRRV